MCNCEGLKPWRSCACIPVAMDRYAIPESCRSPKDAANDDITWRQDDHGARKLSPLGDW